MVNHVYFATHRNVRTTAPILAISRRTSNFSAYALEDVSTCLMRSKKLYGKVTVLCQSDAVYFAYWQERTCLDVKTFASSPLTSPSSTLFLSAPASSHFQFLALPLSHLLSLRFLVSSSDSTCYPGQWRYTPTTQVWSRGSLSTVGP
jgi:hypothetical protein